MNSADCDAVLPPSLPSFANVCGFPFFPLLLQHTYVYGICTFDPRPLPPPSQPHPIPGFCLLWTCALCDDTKWRWRGGEESEEVNAPGNILYQQRLRFTYLPASPSNSLYFLQSITLYIVLVVPYPKIN